MVYSLQLLILLVLVFTPLYSCETHYDVLGVHKKAKAKEIKKAYHRLANEWHPDKNKDPKANEMMSKINQAYKILSDERHRRRYDLIGDDTDYYSRPSRTSSFTSKIHNRPAPKLSNEIDSDEFMDRIVPNSETTPYLVYFFHDFCDQCKEWAQILKKMEEDLQFIGIEMVSVDVIISREVAHYCNIYVHEIPKLVLLIDKKVHPFSGNFNLIMIKEFIRNQLPGSTIMPLSNDLKQLLSVHSRVKSNKPLILLLSPRIAPSLPFKLSSFRYRKYLDFYFVSSSPESSSELNVNNLKQLDIEEESYFLHVYSDLEEPVDILQGDNFTKDNSIAVLKRNNFLTLPRVNSCWLLDELCPGGPRTRWCVLLVTEPTVEATQNFRSLANNKADRHFNTGYLNKEQESTLLSTVINGSVSIFNTPACADGTPSRPVLILNRLTSDEIEFSWYSGYCGTLDDDSELLKQIEGKVLMESATLDKCWFDIETDDSSLWNILPTEVKQLLFEAWECREFIWEHMEKILATTVALIFVYSLLRLKSTRDKQLLTDEIEKDDPVLKKQHLDEQSHLDKLIKE